ncbi:ABC transporter ATP-binding protein [Fundicoccus culcitae]|uniref:ABC transporter ATP-binding protein n=1 Tax=Fundicoccus culcitae TaxID=2969821 RepID=A0ABY5P3X6_9LACT|nr:ABC transporter ATP-binding protein [Fundicoccus culcitae]UUX33442.1 ABC transporter ATP-binding protein [Fundicoccus culcitae]
MAEVILRTENLKKAYATKSGKPHEAVKGITMDVKKGEIFGFLGPNGAGKSTTINMLTTQLISTSGDIYIDGESLVDNPAKARQKIGVVAQHNNLDRGLTARENLIYHAMYFGIDKDVANKRADDLLEKFGLTDRQHDYVKTYSGGMAQRLKIARAIMHEPEIIFLDEPTTGLDPAYREILWNQMLELNKEGTTIFLTTHYMEEPEQLCDRVAIVDKGEMQAIGTVDELKAMMPTNNIVYLRLKDMKEAYTEQAKELPGIDDVTIQDGVLQLYTSEKHPDLNAILNWVNELGTTLEDIRLSQVSLNDVFIYLTEDKKEMKGAE